MQLNHVSLKSLRVSEPTKTTLFECCSTDSTEFLSMLHNRWPCPINSLSEILHYLLCEERWILPTVVAVPSVVPVPVTVEKASPSSYIGKYLLKCPFHTKNNKYSCSPVAVLEIYSNDLQVATKLQLVFVAAYGVPNKLHVVI